MKLSQAADLVVRFGFFLLFILVPLILTPWNWELFEYNKMMVTYALTTVIVGAWIVKMVAHRQLFIKKTPLDIPILLFFLSQLIATIFSMDPHVSWFGYYSRFNGGMWSITSYILLYYALVSNMDKKLSDSLQPTISNLQPLFNILLAAAGVVALYGVAEHLGIDKNLWVQDVQNRVFSTLGQPNWLAAFLVALIPLSIAFILQTSVSKIRHWSFIIYHLSFIILFFTVLLFTRSRSGLIGFAISDVLFWSLLFFILKRNSFPRLPFVICHLAFGIIIIFNGTHVDALDRWVTLSGWQDRVVKKTMQTTTVQPKPAAVGPALESGGTESGTIRSFVWQGAVNAWRSSTKTILIGTGTETFAFAFYQHKPQKHNLTSEWDFLYNKAHNEYLNYLATTGLFGLGTYLLVIGVFTVWFIKMLNAKCQMLNKRKENLSFIIYHLSLVIGLLAGWVSLLVTNFFGFSVVVTQLLFFLFPATVIMILDSSREYRTLRLPPMNVSLFIVVASLTELYLLYHLGTSWYADTLFAAGYRLNRAGQFAQADQLLTQAVKLNQGEPLYHDERSNALASLAMQAAQKKDATQTAQLAKESMSESDTALEISPNNVNFWKSRTKIFYSFSSFDPQMNQAAIESLRHAFTLAPTDPKIAYNLAILYGRTGDNAKAIEWLKTAKNLKPNYRDAYWALSIFYNEAKQPDMARATLEEYLKTVDPNDKEFLQKLK